MFKSACGYDKDIIFYFDALGNKYVARGGSLAWRLNNPGLVRSHCHFAYRNGAIGSYQGLAIFSSPQQGRRALIDLLKAKKYFHSTVKALGKLYQPKNPNEFVSKLALLSAIPINKKIHSFSKEEFDCLVIAVEKICEYSPIGNETFALLPKIYARLEGKNCKDLYLIGNHHLLSKEETIDWIQNHRLDGVLVYQEDGNIHIRSRPSYSMWNIYLPEDMLPPMEGEIDTILRIVGEKKENQCIWGFVNGVWNSKVAALESAQLISTLAEGEQVLSLPNDTIDKASDVGVCALLKASINTPVVRVAARFFRYLLFLSEQEDLNVPVIIFAHSMGAIICEHALELLEHKERQKLRIFTFGGGSFIADGKCHSDSHNFASAKDLICLLGSPNLRTLAMRRYLDFKEDLSQDQMISKWVQEDTIFFLDSIDPSIIRRFEEQRKRYYEEQLAIINNITILEPGSGYEHSFCIDCYQGIVQSIIKKYRKKSLAYSHVEHMAYAIV